MRTGLTAVGAAMLFLVMGTMAWADEAPKCQLARIANLPFSIDRYGLMEVPVTIKGAEFHFLVDTGSLISFLTEGSTKKLNLKPDISTAGWVTFFGGRKSNRFVFVEGMTIGRLQMPRIPMMVSPDDDTTFDGLLGDNLMSIFDLELDIANGRIGLFSQSHCPGKVVYWSKDQHAEIPFKLDSDVHIRFDVEIDGKSVPAMLDTGSTDTIMSAEYAKRHFDITDAQIKKNTPLFKTLSVGGITVNNPNIDMVPNEESRLIGESGQPKMIIGMNMLRWLHLYIAYKEHMVYATEAGAH